MINPFEEPDWPPKERLYSMQQTPPTNDFDRFRGWTLVALYGSMAVLCFMLLYALFITRAYFADRSLEYLATIAATLVAAGFNALTASRHYKLLQVRSAMPRLALKPFFFMAVTLLFAGRLFASL